MEAIKDERGLGQVPGDGLDVRLRPIGGHGLDLRPRAPQTPPERVQGLRTLALSHKHDGSAREVQDHGDVAVPLADGDLVDGDLLQRLEPWPSEPTLEMAPLDLLGRIPGEVQVPGDVGQCGELQQLRDVPRKAAGVVLLGRREGGLDLPLLAAAPAKDARDRERKEHRFAADRHAPPATQHAALGVHVRRTAVPAAVRFPRLVDGEDHRPRLVAGPDIPVASNPERMVQQARGPAV